MKIRKSTFVQGHALFKSTPGSSGRFIQVHAWFKSTLCSIYPLLRSTPYLLNGPHPKGSFENLSLLKKHTFILRPRFVLRPCLFSVSFCFRFEFVGKVFWVTVLTRNKIETAKCQKIVECALALGAWKDPVSILQVFHFV